MLDLVGYAHCRNLFSRKQAEKHDGERARRECRPQYCPEMAHAVRPDQVDK